MKIIHIKGPAKSGKTLNANTLRTQQINAGKGALIVDETTDGEPRYLLEKIVAGASLDREIPAKDVPWKPDSLVILVNDRIDILDEFEALVPGFNKLFGEPKTLNLSAPK